MYICTVNELSVKSTNSDILQEAEDAEETLSESSEDDEFDDEVGLVPII